MPMLCAYDDIDPSKVWRTAEGGQDRPATEVWTFFKAPSNRPRDPRAILVRYGLGTESSAHYHGTDEFQIVVEGKGLMGRHELSPVSVHFARAYTPYGPLIPDKELGWGFLTLRVRPDPVGTQRLPAARDRLLKIPNRKPWQKSVPVAFEREGLMQVPGFDNGAGLFVHALKLGPGASAVCPPPSGGDGQYIVVTQGSLVHQGSERRAITLVHLRDDEDAYTLCAGASGVEALVLNFPQPLDIPAPKLQVLRCKGCSFTYDQAQGLPSEDIRSGTPWEDFPASWKCPGCGAAKDEFKEVA